MVPLIRGALPVLDVYRASIWPHKVMWPCFCAFKFKWWQIIVTDSMPGNY